MSVAPQSLASLAAYYRMSLADANRRLAQFLAAQGVERMIDANLGRRLSLLATQRELTAALADAATDAVKLPILASSCPGWICFAEKSHGWILDHVSRAKSPMSMCGEYLRR